MKIQSSNVAMATSYESISKTTKQESLELWVGERNPGNNARTPVDKLEISRAAQDMCKGLECKAKGVDSEMEDGAGLPPKLRFISRLLEHVFGVKVRIADWQDIKNPDKACEDVEKAMQKAQAEAAEPQKEGWGAIYHYHESVYEKQQLDFTASGTVKTADGREIKFNLDLSAMHEYQSETNVNIMMGDAKKIDPLVINFDGLAAELTDTRFSFDLDADGTQDNIAFTRQGSGFLAFDRNADGIINDGTELFGPQTGDGFGELAELDEDGNGWIDEGDSVFDRLSIYTKSPDGTDNIISIRDAGLGAISLQDVAARFDMKDSNNELNGQTRKLGIYLNENGSVGSIQQIDLYA